ncbi:DNA methyltransferase [Halorussus gelatinilyticus]|uniref:DNA methyltransferase n=1 Tax=Halorussus gelatinilyticus TaxID=2937524 RepID=A0A8U0IK63_9EURY|nr:DNA methyltransferase [Halorussus gelatinilyticus]
MNEIAEKEGRAQMYYRPVYAMHKWWARRLGSVFRAISLYTLLDDPEGVSVFEPGHEGGTLADYGDDADGESDLDVASLLERVDMTDPESLWELYPKDVRVEDKKILDPFMGGGTSLVEASRFGAEVVGNDLNPVAWFTTKKELEAGQTDVEELEAAFEQVKEDVADEITQYYKTPCPNGDHDADVMYNFWVKELDCVSCGHTVPLFGDYRVAKGRYENDEKYNVLCPDCGAVTLVDDWQSESMCNDCGHGFTPKDGNVGRSKYNCPDCGQKYSITDAIDEQGGYDLRLYAIEYYCSDCDAAGEAKSQYKGYKRAEESDFDLVESAREEWEDSPELHEFVPQEKIPEGAITAASSVSGNDIFRHGYEDWSDLFSTRQLLSLSKLLKSIDEIEDDKLRELLLLAFSGSLRYTNFLVGYHHTRNHIHDIFKTNSFNSPTKPTEGNVWGTEYGLGSFASTYESIRRGVEYANSPTERYMDGGEMVESEKFAQPIGDDATVLQGDMRELEYEDEFDAVITDPPYYDNIIYSEVSDYFYVWQKILLEDEYSGFDKDKTPRAESIVTNPYLDKTAEDFESELGQAFSVIRRALKDNGTLTFTYHHSDSESWGELLESLCNVGFEVTATYPITADINKFIEGEAVTFDIVVVARPIDDTEPASWNSLRRDIYRTARRTRQKLEENRDLSRGDIGVMEMGACFREYSKHHGKVQRDGEIMSAKEVVQEIYGIIQEASDIGVEDVFIDLLDTSNPSFDDVNKLCRGTNATPEDLKETHLYNQDDGFELGTWDNEKRQAYIQERVNGDGGEHLSNLDKLQFLRYRYEKGQAVQNYVEKWDVDDDLRELAGRLADVTGDGTYTRVLGDRDITSYGE